MSCNYFCDGVEKAPQRSLFNALGFTKEETPYDKHVISERPAT